MHKIDGNSFLFDGEYYLKHICNIFALYILKHISTITLEVTLSELSIGKDKGDTLYMCSVLQSNVCEHL